MRSHRLQGPILAASVALGLALGACSSSRPASPPPGEPPHATMPPPRDTSPPPTPEPIATPRAHSSSEPRSSVGDYREVIKLYRANISEDFIVDRIRQDNANYNLSADQVIELRNSGVSERVIQTMLDSSRAPQGYADAAPRRPPDERVVVDAAPLSPPRSSSAPALFEGLVRRESGIVILKNRWRVGALTFADGQIRWVDARDSSKNLLIPERAVVEQFLTCMKKSGGNECFEWGFRTSTDDEYRFRDVSWQQNVDAKALSVHDYFKSRFPSLIDSQRPVDEK